MLRATAAHLRLFNGDREFRKNHKKTNADDKSKRERVQWVKMGKNFYGEWTKLQAVSPFPHTFFSNFTMIISGN